MVRHNRATELRDVRLKVNQILRLLKCLNIIKMDVFIAPFEVVDNPLVCQLFFHYEQILEKFDDSLIYIEMVKLGYHRLLILEILFIAVDQGIPLINH
jgi:hypothetical protein